jgi:hypothetical protein
MDKSMVKTPTRLLARLALSLLAAAVLSPPLLAQPRPPRFAEALTYNAPRQAAPRGPLARLVRNPDRSEGMPPFALTDQTGTIQRYVEPVPGIDLAPHVGQVVTVRHDTGPTLLASQLELPPQPLVPMLGLSSSSRAGLLPMTAARHQSSRSDRRVRQAQYADEDDATVELLGDDEQVPQGDAPPIEGSASDAEVYPEGAYPSFPGGMPTEPMMVPGGMMPQGGMMHPGGMMQPMEPGPGYYYDPMYSGAPGMNPYPPGYGAPPCPHEYGMSSCPECGGCPQCGDPCCEAPQPHFAREMDYVRPFSDRQRQRTRWYAEIELNAIRAHWMEKDDNKLSEEYEFSPRFIVGFTGLGSLDGRVRYWLYDRENEFLSGDGSLRWELDVIDIEATHPFAGKRSEVVLAAGVRLARIELTHNDLEAGCDLAGLTMAADGRTPLLKFKGGRLGWAYGGRLSILGGDWGGHPDHLFVNQRVRDDNVVVHELYAGVELAHCYRDIDLRAQFAFEMQNWHSDVLADNAEHDSIGFLGPGLRLGAEF